MEQYIYDENNGLWYECDGDYYIPCLKLPEINIGIWGESYLREEDLSPYHVYMKMAYHLSQEARSGISDFKLPREFKNTFLDYQQKAVLIAAQHLHKRNGVIVGDVVGLGNTITA